MRLFLLSVAVTRGAARRGGAYIAGSRAEGARGQSGDRAGRVARGSGGRAGAAGRTLAQSDDRRQWRARLARHRRLGTRRLRRATDRDGGQAPARPADRAGRAGVGGGASERGAAAAAQHGASAVLPDAGRPDAAAGARRSCGAGGAGGGGVERTVQCRASGPVRRAGGGNGGRADRARAYERANGARAHVAPDRGRG